MKKYHLSDDLDWMMEKVFEAAQKCGKVWKDEFSDICKEFPFFDDLIDFYPAYSYPPFNSYLDCDNNMIFEFALAGFQEKDMSLNFQGDYMLFSVKAPKRKEDEPIRYFKRRLRIKDISVQKYYVPRKRFNQEKVNAVFKNGLLRIVIPAKTEIVKDDERKIDIKNEDVHNK